MSSQEKIHDLVARFLSGDSTPSEGEDALDEFSWTVSALELLDKFVITAFGDVAPSEYKLAEVTGRLSSIVLQAIELQNGSSQHGACDKPEVWQKLLESERQANEAAKQFKNIGVTDRNTACVAFMNRLISGTVATPLSIFIRDTLNGGADTHLFLNGAEEMKALLPPIAQEHIDCFRTLARSRGALERISKGGTLGVIELASLLHSINKHWVSAATVSALALPKDEAAAANATLVDALLSPQL